ncbi:MAG TPA: NUDIX domain-containing protein [Methylocystis sp.]|nr:NUDIX domain-containing protein [Methylocystis sp.]
MDTWRPASKIVVKALGLHWRDDRLLAFEVCNSDGRVKGVRPLGGGVRFRESAKDAVLREFKEELGVEVVILGTPVVMENIYIHDGVDGHEVLFMFDVAFPIGAFEGQERIVYHEDNGTPCVARWYDINKLDLDGGIELYPKGLKPFLVTRHATH